MSSQKSDLSSVAMLHGDLIRQSDFQSIAVGDIDAYRLNLESIACRIKEQLGIDVEASERWLDLAELQEEVQRSRSTQKDSQNLTKAHPVIEVRRLTGIDDSAGYHTTRTRQPSLRSVLEKPGNSTSRAISGPSPRRSKRIQRLSMSPPTSARPKSGANVKLSRSGKHPDLKAMKLCETSMTSQGD